MKRTGFIAIVGRPNVGKSTILNALTGEKISIISHKPQTTRNRITGILTDGEDQFVFLDTPGMHRAKTKLGDYMVKSVSLAMADVDACILTVEAGQKPGDIERALIERFVSQELPAVLAINKTDLSTPEKIGATIQAYSEMFDFSAVVPMSAAKKDGVDILLSEVRKLLGEGEWFFAADDITDQPERQIAAEIIREKILRLLDEEVPHGTAVVIEEFNDNEKPLHIRAEIFCEKASHKGIIIGKNGQMLKKIGSWSRRELEGFFGCRIYLDLWVKVKENWRDSDFNLSNFGYDGKEL